MIDDDDDDDLIGKLVLFFIFILINNLLHGARWQTVADSTSCPFWKNRFNRDWHQRKYSEIRENRVKSIHSVFSREWELSNMIFDNLKIFSQNVRKNAFIVNTILETYSHFDIILLQEPPWSIIRTIPSSTCCEGEALVGSPNHPNWLSFARLPVNQSDCPRVMAYVNIRLSSFCFSLRKDIINHKDILLILFFSNNVCSFIMNIYSDLSHSALKYLKDTEVNINNLLIMTGDFNIRDRFWDPSFPHHSSISDDLFIIADSFNLELSTPTNPVPTRYSDTTGESNSVIDLMFLCNGSSKLNGHIIHPDWQLMLDHAPLTITIPITEEFVQSSKLTIPKKSKEEEKFVKEVISIFKSLNTSSITNCESLEQIVNSLASRLEQVWFSNARNVNITKHSKKW